MSADIHTIAVHEAGHAVMRWIRRLPITAVWADEEDGLCEGCGKPIDAETNLLLTLAGFATEADYMLLPERVNLAESDGDDFDSAWRILHHSPHLRNEGESTEGALMRWMILAGHTLYPYRELVERLGFALAQRRHLSARSVSAIIREWCKRNEPDPTDPVEEGENLRALNVALVKREEAA
jgi:hypothetical protein